MAELRINLTDNETRTLDWILSSAQEAWDRFDEYVDDYPNEYEESDIRRHRNKQARARRLMAKIRRGLQ